MARTWPTASTTAVADRRRHTARLANWKVTGMTFTVEGSCDFALIPCVADGACCGAERGRVRVTRFRAQGSGQVEWLSDSGGPFPTRYSSATLCRYRLLHSGPRQQSSTPLPMTEPQTVRTETPPIPQPAVDGKYVYCIIRLDKPKDFGSVGIGGGQRVYTVHYRDLAAIVSDTPLVIYDPTREHVLAHEFVNETVMREFTVIPMSFGTVFRSEDDVTELLRSTYQAFSDVLDKMQDKIEFGLKILWDRDK